MQKRGFSALMMVLTGCAMLIVESAYAELQANVRNGIVFSDPRLFGGWPANYGLWQWDDEVLVSFALCPFIQRSDFHNIDDKAYQCEVFARSLDGGNTWTIEEHPEVSIPGRFDEDGRYVKNDSYPPIPKAVDCPGNIDFGNPDFALRAWRSTFFISHDRGHNWQGPYKLPDFGFQTVSARTNYIVTGPQSCRLFYSVTNVDRKLGEHGRIMMVETTDGGKTFQHVAWICADPLEGLDNSSLPAYAIMPGVLAMPDGVMLSTIRWRIKKDYWIDLAGSSDGGRTWSKWSDLRIDNGNPASIVSLGGQRIVMVYGWRNRPFGLRGRISEDGGRTWSDEYVLRDDGREWDLGYVRAAAMPDGQVLVVYYYTTQELRPEHIAFTLWTPPAPETPAPTN